MKKKKKKSINKQSNKPIDPVIVIYNLLSEIYDSEEYKRHYTIEENKEKGTQYGNRFSITKSNQEERETK